MIHVRTAISMVTAVLVLVACATGPSPQQIERARQAPPTRIGLLTVPEPDLYRASLMDTDLPNVGVTLPGRLVGLAMTSALKGANDVAHNYRVTETLREAGFSISEQLTRDVTQELEAAGYEVVPMPVDQHRHASAIRQHRALTEIPKTEVPVDFLLHVLPEFVGYVALAPGEPMAPMLKTSVMLTSVSGRPHYSPSGAVHGSDGHDSKQGGSGALLFHDHMTYGGPVPVEGPRDMPSDPRYAFRDHSRLEDPNVVIQGLKGASEGMAELIARALR